MLMFTKKVDEQQLQKKLRSCSTFEDTSHLLIGQLLKRVKVDISHSAMEIDLKTTEHVVAMEN